MIVLHHDYSGYKAYKNHYWREKFMSLSLILKFQKLQFPRALEESVSYLQKASFFVVPKGFLIFRGVSFFLGYYQLINFEGLEK